MNHSETIKHRRKWVDQYKTSNGCCVCGYNKHPAALCFDHLPGCTKAEITKNGGAKRTCAGGMYRLYSKHHPIEDLVDEIKKCRLLCSNCHMEHTHTNLLDNSVQLNPMSLEDLEKGLKNEL